MSVAKSFIIFNIFLISFPTCKQLDYQLQYLFISLIFLISFNIFLPVNKLTISCNIFQWFPPPRVFSYHRLQILCSVQEGVEKLLILVLRVVVDLGGSLLKWKSASRMLFWMWNLNCISYTYFLKLLNLHLLHLNWHLHFRQYLFT